MRTNGRIDARRALAAAVTMAALLLTAVPTAFAGGDWNDANVQWQPYEAGLAAAKKDKKPVLLIFFTEWCPHCTNYSKVFHDPQVVETSKKLVMIRLDKDKNGAVSGKYMSDYESKLSPCGSRPYFMSVMNEWSSRNGPSSETVASNCDRSTSWPSPVWSRHSSAAVVAMTP